MTSASKILDFTYTQYFIDNLDQADSIQAEYVWLGGNNGDLRCKTKTIYGTIKSIEDLPIWNYDGSSTNQADGHDSEVLLKPRRIFRDPFRRGKNILVLCDTFNAKNGEPLATNSRYPAEQTFNKKLEEEPWFGIEQEYTLFTTDGHPLGWPKGGYPGPQGPYYCAAGANVAHGRAIVEAHYRCCLYAGVKIAGINAEVMPGQWEYQVGPCVGIEAGDHMWMSRYIMHRLGEIYGIVVSFDPKPIPGNWNGAGAHTNYSTKAMREEGGYKTIIEAIEKLGKKHMEHIEAYGEGNERRLTGHHETAHISKFSYGVANRGSSCRIPRDTEKNGCGYFEDRRPAANMDPYVVTAKIFDTTCIQE